MVFIQYPFSLVAFWALWCSYPDFAEARRNQISDAMECEEQATCSPPRELRCADAAVWVENQRSHHGECGPNNPPYIRCKGGEVPLSTAWLTWTPDENCSDHYVIPECQYSNAPISHGSLKSVRVGGNICFTNPKLSAADCQLISIGASSIQVSQNEFSKIYSLGHSITEVYRKEPDEWIWVPSLRFAVSRLSQALQFSIESRVLWNRFLSKKQMQEVWLVFLKYCRGAKVRQIDLDKIGGHHAGNGQEECIGTTLLNKLIDHHPWQEAFQTAPETISSLEELFNMGLLQMGEDLLEELCLVAGDAEAVHMRHSYKRFKDRFQELLRTAGERGEQELQLGLTLSKFKSAEGVQPEGGERRLAEVSTFRHLKNMAEADQLSANVHEIQTAVRNIGKLVENGGNFKWIDPARVHEIKQRLTKLTSDIQPRSLLQNASVVEAGSSTIGSNTTSTRRHASSIAPTVAE